MSLTELILLVGGAPMPRGVQSASAIRIFPGEVPLRGYGGSRQLCDLVRRASLMA